MTVMTIFQYSSYKKEFKPVYKTWETDPLILLKNLGKFSQFLENFDFE
jgi:hypothetical protein